VLLQGDGGEGKREVFKGQVEERKSHTNKEFFLVINLPHVIALLEKFPKKKKKNVLEGTPRGRNIAGEVRCCTKAQLCPQARKQIFIREGGFHVHNKADQFGDGGKGWTKS